MATGRRPATGAGAPPRPPGAARSSAGGAARPRAKPAGGNDVNPMDYFGSNVFEEGDFGTGLGDAAGGAIGAPTGSAEPEQSFGGDMSTDDFGGLSGGAEPALISKSPDEYFGAESSDDFGSASELGAAPAPARRRRWPKGRSPDADSLPIDDAEVRMIAEYPEAPASFFLAPIYSLKVLQRKRVLSDRVKQLVAALETAERERDEQLMAMVQKTRPLLEPHRQLKELFGPVTQAEKLVEDRRRELQGANAEYDQKSKALSEQISKAEQEIAEQRAIETERRAAVEERQKLLARAEATKKRLFIEIRSIVEQSEKQGGSLTPQQSAKVKELEAKNAAFKPELERATNDLRVAEGALDAVTSGIARLRTKGRELEKQAQGLDHQFEKQIGARSEGLQAAERHRRSAFAEVGRAALALKGRVPLDEELVDAIERADETVNQAALDLERYARALNSYDASAYKKGFGLAAGLFGVLVLALVIAIGAVGSSDDEPAEAAPPAARD